MACPGLPRFAEIVIVNFAELVEPNSLGVAFHAAEQVCDLIRINSINSDINVNVINSQISARPGT